MLILQRVFGLAECGTSVGQEVRAGAAAFLTMSYVAIKSMLGRFKEVHPLMLGLSILLAAWRTLGAA